MTELGAFMATRTFDRSRLFDIALVAVLLIVGLLQEYFIRVPSEGNFGQGGDLLGGVTVAAAVLPLLWRRHYPVWVMAAGLVVYFVRVFLGYQPGSAFNIVQFVAIYSVGVYGVRPLADRARWIAAAALAGAFLLSVVVNRYALPTVLVYFAVWTGIGIFAETVYVRRRYQEAVEERARQLEADREARARLAVQAERARISREFHDIWAHTLSLVVVQANAAAETFDEQPEFARQALANIQQAGRQALAEVRRLIASDMTEPSRTGLTPVPGILDLPRLVEDFGRAGVSVTLKIGDAVAELPADVALYDYRIVQQALTNTLSHGGPVTGARVDVRTEDGQLLIDVVDNGRGAAEAPDPTRTGRGIIGMRERAMLFGGDLVAGRQPEGGFAVHARIPLGGTP
jgi:signal transduction histidine kinase